MINAFSTVSSVPLERKKDIPGLRLSLKRVIIGSAADHASPFPCQNEPFSSTLHKIPSPNFCTCSWFVMCNISIKEEKKSSVFISSPPPKPDFLWDRAKVCIYKCMYNREVTLKR